MSNNTVELSGYLVVGRVSTLEVGRQQMPVVEGWVITDLAHLGGKHPFTAAGKPADVILDYARRSDVDLLGAGEDHKVGVTARGRLVSGEHSFLQVKHISFFDVAFPLVSTSAFVANSVRMQGDLQLAGQVTVVEIGSTRITVMDAHLVTDRSYLGGRHPVILAGKLGECAQAIYKRLAMREGERVELPATVGGHLVTVNGATYVRANFLSMAAP